MGAGDLTHLNQKGEAHMVDVGQKASTRRTATASAKLSGSPEAMSALFQGTGKKGDALAVARVAGIMAAKKTADLVPLCHPLALSKVSIDIVPIDNDIAHIEAHVETTGQTGVEMEAMTAASVTALTLYDMLKSIDKALVISELRLESKTGGKSGTFRRQ
ncbi:MAG: cyclic pyranopterin monophosphate synthase MoaC [Hyphomicrobiaceae bacterium]|nr:cyclic pyranopterin monophosphate synthase MoaC [Hyphomicrobiaceae bacterium]MCC0023469.1 cyclic pyranopterin monophosphate synthase MoaC [Hyphomicrobiaceae bacterium]